MADKTIVSILEEKKEEIMSHIELAVIDSYMPDLCGFFEICMRGWGGAVGRYVTEEGRVYDPQDPPLYVLYRVRNHAGRKNDFIQWLSKAGIHVHAKCSEKRLRQKYHKEYMQFWEENKQDGMWIIANLESEFEKIKAFYQSQENHGA